MLASDRLEQVRKLATEVSVREGCKLYDIEFVGAAAGRTLRVYIDKADGQGVSVEDCSNVSRGLNLLLDVDDLVPGGRYQLEVSSPGMERQLRQPEHFQDAINKTVHVRTFAPLLEFNPTLTELGKAKQIQGELARIQDDGFFLKVKMGEVFVPYKTLTKAHLVVDFDQVLASTKPTRAL